jgi:LAO/AO transport system kinase
MDIDDIFVFKKSDRPDSDAFVKILRLMLAPAFHNHREVPIIKTIGNNGSGVQELYNAIEQHAEATAHSLRKSWLLTERVFQLVQQHRMNNIDKDALYKEISLSLNDRENFNLYRFAKKFY